MFHVGIIGGSHVFSGDGHGFFDTGEDGSATRVKRPVEVSGSVVFRREGGKVGDQGMIDG